MGGMLQVISKDTFGFVVLLCRLTVNEYKFAGLSRHTMRPFVYHISLIMLASRFFNYLLVYKQKFNLIIIILSKHLYFIFLSSQ
jgi:hypothetical protein